MATTLFLENSLIKKIISKNKRVQRLFTNKLVIIKKEVGKKISKKIWHYSFLPYFCTPE
jgi:hypothetical protein